MTDDRSMPREIVYCFRVETVFFLYSAKSAESKNTDICGMEQEKTQHLDLNPNVPSGRKAEVSDLKKSRKKAKKSVKKVLTLGWGVW